MGTSWLSSVMARHGRRRGLLLGYFTAAVAAALAAMGASLDIFLLLCVAIFALGAGYGASRLSRYAAADLYEPEKRARAIGWVVWAGTFGSVLGPTLLEPSRRVGIALGFPSVSGPFLLVALAMFAAGTALWVGLPHDHYRADLTPRPPMRFHHLRTPDASLAILALVVGQVVMLLIMTMTPVYLRSTGGSLSAIGAVIAAHTFGMYALSPISGILSDRFGRRPMIVVAGVLLIAAGAVSALSGPNTSLLALGLFLLGWGWNLGFVSASALLTVAVPAEDRMRVQGFADSIVWTSAAIAGLSSGVVLNLVGFGALCVIGGVLALAPMSAISAMSFRRVSDGV